jgi:hypothetical protein
MSIGLRIECDFVGCTRHFEINGAIDLQPRAHRGRNGQAYAVFSSPFVTLPAGWAALSPPEGAGIGVCLFCREHATPANCAAVTNALGESFAHG